MDGTCTALNVGPQSRCQQKAINANGLFCGFHARQVHNLYEGYKRRGQELEQLDASPPAYLANAKVSLRNETFENIEDEVVLSELWKYLFRKNNLLNRVIRARKFHHTHFYAQNSDFGHKAYLDKLVNDKNVIAAALERLMKRTNEVLFSKQKWYSWVTKRQDAEEEARDKEAVKIKKEAQLFRRHMKQLDARAQRKKKREDKKRQDAYLDEAYEERLRLDEVSNEYEAEWDPIEDDIEGEREDFIALMKRLLWLPDIASDEGQSKPSGEIASSKSVEMPVRAKPASEVRNGSNPNPGILADGSSTIAKSRNAKKRAKAKAKVKDAAAESKAIAKVDQSSAADGSQDQGGNRIEVNETRDEMHRRLVDGCTYEMEGMYAFQTIENPISEPGQIPGLPESEVNAILDEVADIKELLFCRILLSLANVLPAALRASSIPELLADPEVTVTDIRDLCLRVERPELQEIRDACADFARGDGEESDEEAEGDDEQTAYELSLQKRHEQDPSRSYWQEEKKTDGSMPNRWRSKHEIALDERAEMRKKIGLPGRNMMDFGIIDDEGHFRNKKIRVRVCGRTIWNYPSEKAMARGGWLHFSIIAKGSRFEDAAALCRNWEEFRQLSTLAIFNYFPTPGWATWAFEHTRQSFVKHGMVPYLSSNLGGRLSERRQTYDRQTRRRVYHFYQCRDVMSFYIKRNDPVSRRFVQYLNMNSGRVCIMVRDCKTGKILEPTPPKDQLWLIRSGVGYDRPDGDGLEVPDWTVIMSVGEDLFGFKEGMTHAPLRFGFTEVYDITIWSTMPGEHEGLLTSTVKDAMIKALRICNQVDMYGPVASIIDTLHRDQKTGCARDIHEGETSILGDLQKGGFIFSVGEATPGSQPEWSQDVPSDFFYNDVDAAEDLILFPEEANGRALAAITEPNNAIYQELMSRRPNFKRFILDLDSDEESDDFENPMIKTTPALEGESSKLLNDVEQPTGEHRDIDDDSQWESDEEELELPDIPDDVPECPSSGQDLECRCEECLWFEENAIEERIEKRLMKIDGAQLGIDDLGHVPFDEHDVQELHADNPVLVTSLNNFIFREPAIHSRLERDTEVDFITFMDREKAKIFKKQWHAVDFDPESQARWREMQEMVKEARKLMLQDRASCIKAFELLMWLDVKPWEHRRVVQDMWDAMALMSFFFVKTEERKMKAYLARWLQRADSEKPTLADNERKAKLEPYRRSYRSNKTMPKAFWDEVKKDYDRKSPDGGPPKEYDMIVRTATARLLKAGIIDPGYNPSPFGQAIAAKAPSFAAADMYIDYRSGKDYWPEDMNGLNDPYKVHLLPIAEQWASKHENARFALLRVWSHSHFYPLMIAGNSKEFVTHADTLGRPWAWNFMPKDMPGTEWSMHKNVEDRVWGVPTPKHPHHGPPGSLAEQIRQGQGERKFTRQFEGRVEVRRDIVLVMGEDEKDLQKYAIAATFAIQTDPWRMEVDLWKSFVNVDLAFLQGLDKKWLE